MITDGEPTAHINAGMSAPFFSYPPVQATVDATLREVQPLHAGRHPHQHLHARRHAVPQDLHRDS